MIVVEVKLQSAISRSRDSELTTLLIGNDGTAQAAGIGNYDVRVYRKGALAKHDGSGFALWHGEAKPTRAGRVEGHRRLAEPVGNLVAKALASVGYA